MLASLQDFQCYMYSTLSPVSIFYAVHLESNHCNNNSGGNSRHVAPPDPAREEPQPPKGRNEARKKKSRENIRVCERTCKAHKPKGGKRKHRQMKKVKTGGTSIQGKVKFKIFAARPPKKLVITSF